MAVEQIIPDKPAKSGRIHACLQLVRVPNLLTVPGDPLAGYFLAMASGTEPSYGSILIAVTASLLLYIFGLVSNDLFDLKNDITERADRPLPSGRIKPLEATIVTVIMVLAALKAASINGRFSLATAGVLAAVIIVYNCVGKRIPLFGPLNMGLCRGLNLLLGASAMGMPGLTSRVVLMAAALLAAYIAAVTVIAARETSNIPHGSKRWWPAFATAVFLFPLFVYYSQDSHIAAKIFSICIAAVSLIWSWHAGVLLSGAPGPGIVPAVVGRFIQGLLFIQALLLSLCEWPAQIVAAGIILALPVFSILARKFYSS